jgi:hypothetical protein
MDQVNGSCDPHHVPYVSLFDGELIKLESSYGFAGEQNRAATVPLLRHFPFLIGRASSLIG